MNEHEKNLIAITDQFIQSLATIEDYNFDFTCSMINAVRYRRSIEHWRIKERMEPRRIKERMEPIEK